MRARVGALLAGFLLGIGLMSLGAQLAQRPPKQDPKPIPTLDGSVPVSAP